MKQPEFIPGVRSRLDDSLHSTIRPERALFGGITFPNLHHKHEPIHRGKLGYGIDCGTCPCFTWFLPPRIGRFLVPAGSGKTPRIAVLITLRRVRKDPAYMSALIAHVSADRAYGLTGGAAFGGVAGSVEVIL